MQIEKIEIGRLKAAPYNPRKKLKPGDPEKGLSFDGVKGLSPIGQAREAIGLALSTEEYGAKFFGNGARPGGIIEFPGTMKDPDKVRESWNKTFQGAANSHRVAVLEQGAKFQTVGLPPEESQFLETRKFQINEICRIFRVPPHLVGDLEKATFSKQTHTLFTHLLSRNAVDSFLRLHSDFVLSHKLTICRGFSPYNA
jgi:HK97 family phage portal protein